MALRGEEILSLTIIISSRMTSGPLSQEEELLQFPATTNLAGSLSRTKSINASLLFCRRGRAGVLQGRRGTDTKIWRRKHSPADPPAKPGPSSWPLQCQHQPLLGSVFPPSSNSLQKGRATAFAWASALSPPLFQSLSIWRHIIG